MSQYFGSGGVLGTGLMTLPNPDGVVGYANGPIVGSAPPPIALAPRGQAAASAALIAAGQRAAAAAGAPGSAGLPPPPPLTPDQQLALLQKQQADAEAAAAAARAYDMGLVPQDDSHLPLILGIVGVLVVGGIGFVVLRHRPAATAGYRRRKRKKRSRR